MTCHSSKNPDSKRRALWIVLGICVLLSAGLHVHFLTMPGFEDDLLWQIHWGKRLAKGLWKLYEWRLQFTPWEV